jgi:hypothetical protein
MKMRMSNKHILACAMKQLTRAPMSATPWLLLLCLAGAASGGVLQARAQPDSKGMRSRLITKVIKRN